MNYLKILLVLQSPFCNTLGISKVHYDLKNAYENMGHQVDTLSYEDIYPKGVNMVSTIIGPLFTKKILQILKIKAKNYDVIDANYECIPFPKESFGFNGVLIYRSHGLQPLYREFEKTTAFSRILDLEKTKKIKFKTRLGNIYRYLKKKTGNKELYDSIKYADVVHCLNNAEYEFLLNYGIPENKLIVLPNGISDGFILKAAELKLNTKNNIISFVASWTLRKGISDLNTIVNQIKSETSINELKLLGGVEEKSKIESYFETENRTDLNIIATYKSIELPTLLKNVKVGVFPSYIEGFGLAILEQLACGIPVVAYKVPGPIDILRPLDKSLLIDAGDTVKFSQKVVEILEMSDVDYEILSGKCKLRARDFLMSSIASSFIKVYEKHNC
jgi:glycosyltransferase involved in cell wall biosynthesis